MYGMSCSLQRGDGRRQILGSHQQVICIEGGDNKQANSRPRKWRGKRGHDAYFRERKRTMDFQSLPANLGRQTAREAGFFGDYGKLVAGARDGEECATCCPLRNCCVGSEAGDRESLRKHGKLQGARGRGHRELEETSQPLAGGGRRDGDETTTLVIMYVRQSSPGEEGAVHRERIEVGTPVFRLGICMQFRRLTPGIGNTNLGDNLAQDSFRHPAQNFYVLAKKAARQRVGY